MEEGITLAENYAHQEELRQDDLKKLSERVPGYPIGKNGFSRGRHEKKYEISMLTSDLLEDGDDEGISDESRAIVLKKLELAALDRAALIEETFECALALIKFESWKKKPGKKHRARVEAKYELLCGMLEEEELNKVAKFIESYKASEPKKEENNG